MADIRREWADRIRTERKVRGWDKPEMARRLARAAGDARTSLPSHDSLLSYVKRRERGTVGISERYRLLYATVFKTTEDKLFGAADEDADSSPWRASGVQLDGSFSPDDEERLMLAARHPARPDPKAIDSLATILAEQRRLEDTVGSALVLQAVRAQLPVLAELVTEARGPVRFKLVDVAAQWAQFSGWLNIAVGDVSAAQRSLDRAAEHAEEIGDVSMVGTVLSWKAYLAERIGQIGPMIGMAQAAQRNRIGPGHAYDLFLEARGHALAREPREAERILDEAQEAAAVATPAQTRPWEYYYLEPGFFSLEVGVTNVYLGREDPRRNADAVDHLAAGLAELPATMRRAEWAGEYIAHQAVAYLQAAEAEAARAALLDAAGIARATASESLMRKLRRIHERMVRKWPDHPAVSELLDALR